MFLPYALVAVPYVVGLLQMRAAPVRLLLSPVVGAVLAVPAALLVAWLQARAGAALGARAAFTQAALLLLLPTFGYVGGIVSGRSSRPENHKRGTVVERRRALPAWWRQLRGDRRLTLAGHPLEPLDETKHFKLIGTTGTGKSTAIRELLAGAIARGDRAVIADPDAGYLERYYDPTRDLILNPFDPRSARWHLYAEIRSPYDVDQLARALIPEGEGDGREWRGYARTFLASLIRQLHAAGVHELSELYRLLAIAEHDELRTLLGGTPAQPFLESGNERMFGSLRSVAVAATAWLEHVAAHDGAPLSVRDWVRAGESRRGGVLFLPYQADQIPALRAVISAWMRLAIVETMSGGERDHHLWFVVDELDALGTIDGLKDALARLRKFGGRCVLGFQSIAQVSATYGLAEAQTIVENCGNTLILRCSASERGGTAQFASRLIGEREVVRRHISRTRSGTWLEAPRRSTSVSVQHVTEPAVLPSEIEQLPDLAGYLKLASQSVWRRTQLR